MIAIKHQRDEYYSHYLLGTESQITIFNNCLIPLNHFGSLQFQYEKLTLLKDNVGHLNYHLDCRIEYSLF